jgi:CheY-like chemotaxis protein
MTKFRILVADDDEDDYFIIREAFDELVPHEINHVYDGQQLLEYLGHQLELNQSFPDLILLDINMPKMDGVKTLEYIKSSEIFSHIPIVMYSTSSDHLQKKACNELGANGFISKGHNHGEIIDFVRGINLFLEELRSDPRKKFYLFKEHIRISRIHL